MTQTLEQTGERQPPSPCVGVVVRKCSEKTIRVDINTLLKHPQYGKYLRRRTRLAVHDPSNVAQAGDVVEITPCRRLSRTKSWRLVRVVRSGAPVAVQVAAPGAEPVTEKG
jgi:small subunit ribosomal protein S17